MILATVILLLFGLIAWSAVGTLETKAEAKVVVKDYQAQVVVSESETVKEGMPLRIDSQEFKITFCGAGAHRLRSIPRRVQCQEYLSGCKRLLLTSSDFTTQA